MGVGIPIPERGLSGQLAAVERHFGERVSNETGLQTIWSKDEIAWKSPLRGIGVSSPVVWGDRAFVTSQPR